jgi:hypothetical protein
MVDSHIGCPMGLALASSMLRPKDAQSVHCAVSVMMELRHLRQCRQNNHVTIGDAARREQIGSQLSIAVVPRS